MSYLLSKLKELDEFTPEKVKTMLYREGFCDYMIDRNYEIYEFYLRRIEYYSRMQISNPKTESVYQTAKFSGLSQIRIYQIIGFFK